MPDRSPSRLPALILVSAVLGVALGLVVGERAAVLRPFGIAYAKMLEIAVFPYLLCSLLGGLGGLVRERAPRLLRAAWAPFVLVWLVTFATIFLLSLVIPGARPPTVLTQSTARDQTGLIDLLIPANLFAAAHDNFVPAVVVFAIIYGLAIQTVPHKAAFLEIVEVVRKASVTIWMWIVYFAPIGVFALFASAAGTLDPRAAGGLAVYMALYLIGSLVLAFAVLPLILGRILGQRAGALLAELQPAFVLALVTTLSAAALPYIQRAAERMVEREGVAGEEANDVIRATISIGYVMAQLGNYFVALLMLYLAYRANVRLDGTELALLPLMTLLSGVGSPSASVDSVAFLAAWLQLPADATDIYVETMTITRYGLVAVSVMGIAFVTMTVPLAYFGRARLGLARVAPAAALGLAFFAAVAFAGRSVDAVLFPPPNDEAIRARTLDPSQSAGVDVTVRRERLPDLAPLERAGSLEGIRARGRMRVGYGTHIIPFSYTNDQGDVVGYDIAAARRLARALQVALELVPIDWETLEADLVARRYDIVMAGAYVTPDRLARLIVSDFYFSSPLALIVRADLARRFLSYAEVAAMADITLAVFRDPVLVPMTRALFPRATVVTIATYDELPSRPEAAAALWSLDQAAAWTSGRTGYTAVAPAGIGPPLAFAYLMPPGSGELQHYLNLWLSLEANLGIRDAETRYWIRGEPRPAPFHRWNLLDDVLGWGARLDRAGATGPRDP